MFKKNALIPQLLSGSVEEHCNFVPHGVFYKNSLTKFSELRGSIRHGCVQRSMLRQRVPLTTVRLALTSWTSQATRHCNQSSTIHTLL
jgi:hypothetical protein